MNKLFLALGFLFVFPTVVFAQDSQPIQNELVGLINQLGEIVTVLILGAMAEVSTWLTAWVRSWQWLAGKDRDKISGLLANLVNSVSSLLVAVVAIAVAYLIGYVENFDLQMLLTLGGPLWAATWGGSSAFVHKLHKFGRAAKQARSK